jgi:putative DNA primase/helicase
MPRDQAQSSEPPPGPSPGEIEAAVAALAAMPAARYELHRKAEALRLGVRIAVLDMMVKAARKAMEPGGQGQRLELKSPEPWHLPVDGGLLLVDLAAEIRRYMVLPDGAAETVALWVVHAHALDAAQISPRLAIVSPVKGCGKSTLLDVVNKLVPRPLATSNVTGATVFRAIEAACPTLLVDEADTFLTENEELRGILNSGHRRSGAFVTRLVGDDHEPRQFSTWAATAIAMIGRLPDTLDSRSVVVELRRRRPDESVADFRFDRTPSLDRLARQVARWAADNLDALSDADPAMPAGLVNRTADNWRPLLAIADLAGGPWPDRARAVALAAVHARGDDDGSSRTRLLADIREAFDTEGVDRLSSARLVALLVEREDRPWSEFRGGKALTANTLARLLKPFEVFPQSIRLDDGTTPKGYHRTRFDDAFARYLPPQTETSHDHVYEAEL